MNNNYIAQQQKFSNNFQFIDEYYKLITKYYSHWSYSNIHCNYYSLDLENSVIDETKLVNGSYEVIGDLSGMRWRKIIDFPLNQVEVLNTNPTTDEKGVTNTEKMTTAWYPAHMQIEAHVHDFLMFTDTFNTDNYYLRNPPLFEVVNVERSPDFDTPFYKLSLKITYQTKDNIEKQVDGLFHYIEYENKIYGIDDAICLNMLLQERMKSVCGNFYDQKTGLYFEKVDLAKVAEDYLNNQTSEDNP